MATGPTYNKFSSIAIGGPNTNTINSAPYGNTSFDVSGNAIVRNNLTVLGTLTYSGASLTFTDLLVPGNTDIGGYLGVTGPASLYDSLLVGGTGTFNGPVGINNNLGITGNTNILGNLGVTGNTQLTNLTASGTANIQGPVGIIDNINIQGDLGVTGSTQLTSLVTSGNTNIGGDLGVTGSIQGTVINASSSIDTLNLTVTGSSTLQGSCDGQFTTFYTTSSGNTVLESNNYMTLTSNNDLVINTTPTGIGSIYFQVNGTGNLDFLTTSGVTTFNSYDEATFRSQVGAINFATVTSGDINFNPASTYNINLTTVGAGADININSRQNLGLITEYGNIDITTQLAGDISLTAANGRPITLTTSGLGDVTIIGGQNTFVRANNGTLGLKGTDFINFENQIYFDRVPTSAEYTTDNKAIGYTNSINAGTSYTGTASDTTTPAQVGTFTLPARGVWLIQFDCKLTLNTGGDTIENKEIVLSETTASLTECAPGFHFRDPIDDATGSANPRQTYSFCGVYHLTAAATKALYINVIASTAGSRTVTASGNYKYTRIA